MFVAIKKQTILCAVGLAVLFLSFFTILRQGNAVQSGSFRPGEQEDGVLPTLVIDPGHGGEDGGAVAADGTVESQLNLAIALRLEQGARLLGWRTAMTRREDISIHDAHCDTLRQKKVSDLKNRTALCSQVENGVLISIHQNSLPQSPSVRGAQVFYNGRPGSRELAEAIQSVLNTIVNGEAAKTARPIGSGVYLMENAPCPAVLIECGFLSNSRETQLLKSGDYQRRLVSAILGAVTGHLGGGTGQTAPDVVY